MRSNLDRSFYVMLDEYVRKHCGAREVQYSSCDMQTTFILEKGTPFPNFATNYDEVHIINTGEKFVYYGGEWTRYDSGVIAEPPKNKTPPTHPTNCKNCGAVLRSNVCEYCGTHYTE